ncbi:S-layer homology domain-containing protein [Dysosmobacter sp.]|uniref:S-layer homology domain-containing protein n=1 Tax=Dysosmobacter sp. TaxID=2591382 RepID=UPI002A88B1A1|nr:S-layer homology domain-containing protein [Dysosmobacter sp.]MDY3281788.1 S-layer homology domain-containing protein [Dysosmobacter sp.]
MKKRIPALSLLLALLLTVSAAAVGGTGNFVRTRQYSGQFSDLPAASVFYDNVSALYEYGLSVGKGDGTFGLADSVTVNQAVIFAGRIRSLYDHGDPETGADDFRAPGQAAYEPYDRYLRSLGILGDELEGLYGTVATRGTVAHILAGILPEEALPAVNAGVVDLARSAPSFLPDLHDGTAWLEDILTLYRCGVTQGSDGFGTFYPDAPITRGALAAMLTRMVDPGLRISLSWDVAADLSAAGTTYGDLILRETRAVTAPATREEVEMAVAHMLSRNESTLYLKYGSLTSDRAREIMQQALAAAKSCCEQSYNTVNCTFDPNTGAIMLAFSALNCSAEETAAYREYTLDAAIAVHDQLWADGTITAAMTDYEKAAVYFDWICRACAYDYDAGSESLSHIAYSLFSRGKAVCDGYTGAYNLLLKLEGIRCRALSNDSHIWTVAELDGTEYHIDTTWGDSLGVFPDYRYFAMSEETSRRFHPW